MERYSRSPSPYRARPRRRYTSSSPARSPTPTRYRYRSPRESSRRSRSLQRRNDYSRYGSRRSASRSRARSPYRGYARYRSYSIDRYRREERRDEREKSPLYCVQFEDGSTRVFNEVTRFPGPNLNPGTTYACRRAQENDPSNHFGDGAASYYGANLQESSWTGPPATQKNPNMSNPPSQIQQAALLRGRAPQSFNQEQWLRERQQEQQRLREYQGSNLGNNLRPMGNTAFGNGFLPIPTNPRHNVYDQSSANQDTYQQQHDTSLGQERLHLPTHSRYWTNRDTYQQQYESLREQERLRTTRRQDVQDGALQQPYPFFKREPMVRDLNDLLLHGRLRLTTLQRDNHVPHNDRVQPPRHEPTSTAPCPLIKQEPVESLPSSPIPWIKQESVEPLSNVSNQPDTASEHAVSIRVSNFTYRLFIFNFLTMVTPSQSNVRGFWGRMLRWVGV